MVLGVVCLTPLIIAHTTIDTKLLTLYSTGIGLVHAVFYSAQNTLSKDSEVVGRMNLNWFLCYLLLGLAIPSISNMPLHAEEVHVMILVLLATGLFINNFYLVTGKGTLLASSSVFYGLGSGLSFTDILVSIIGDDVSSIQRIVIFSAIAAFFGVLSALVVKALGDNVNLFIETEEK